MSAPRIVLLSGNPLCHNPRVVKEADALSDAGFAVEVLGQWIEPAYAERDRALLAGRKWKFTPVVDLTRVGAERLRQRLRVRSKIGRLLGAWLRLENPWQLGYSASELLAAAREREAALFIAHSEPALWVAEKLRRDGRRVGVDMEDWFSEDLPPSARRGRGARLLRSLEVRLLRSAAHRTCTSSAMSAALAKEFGCAPPAVIYNTFPWAEGRALDGARKDRGGSRAPSVHWFSQTIGPGRGLEDFFAALALVKADFEIHLRGQFAAGGEAWLHGLVLEPWRGKMFTHPLVSNAELPSRIAEHDVGFAGEVKSSRSRDLTVTNKVFQYLLGGLAVLASDTSGQREIAAESGEAVRLYPSGDARALAARLDELLGDAGALASAKAAALRVAEEKFCWEKCAGQLVGAVREAI